MNEQYLQAMIDGMSAKWQRERAESQITLGKLIEILEQMPKDAQVANLDNEHSYRGYYSDLAFEDLGGTRTASDLLAVCKGAMGEIFRGYKGGDYVMGALTPIWVANYGCCGMKLMALHVGGGIETSKDE